MAKQADNTGKHWYVIHTYSGYEDAVKEALLQRIDSLDMHDLIFDVVVPKETQIVIKKGEPKTEDKRIFPGYVLVEMIVTDYSWYVVRNTPNVTGFVGAGTTPVPVSPEEFKVIKKRMGEAEPKFKIDFSVGENVVILDGLTSALDIETEDKVFKNIEEFLMSRTTIMIAHRAETIAKADKILMVKNREIITLP